MHTSIINKLLFILIFNVLVGCSTLQNWEAKFITSKNTPSTKAKVETEEPTKLNWETSALFQEGTKPLLIGTQEDILQKIIFSVET